MTANIIVTVGMGENDTVITGIIADGNVICNIIMSKQQVLDHIALLQRHIALLESPPNHEYMN
jgi:hypothetical protein